MASLETKLDGTYGALFLGVLISAILFGVTNLQTFLYFQQYPNDKIWNKLAVCYLWFLDAFHVALSVHVVYYYLVTNYAQPISLLTVVWSFKLQIVVDVVVVVSVHTLYTIRLWNLLAIQDRIAPFAEFHLHPSLPHPNTSVNAIYHRPIWTRFIPGAISIIVILGCGVGVVTCYEIYKIDTFIVVLERTWVTYMTLGFSTFIDAIIAASLCYFLARCRTGSRRMDSTITVLMFYAVNTGILTSVCSLTAITIMAVFPKTFIVLSVEFLITKLYINSFMAMFNARWHTVHNEEAPSANHSITPNPMRSPCDSEFPAISIHTKSVCDLSQDVHLSMGDPGVTDVDINIETGRLSPLSFVCPPPRRAHRKAVPAADGKALARSVAQPYLPASFDLSLPSRKPHNLNTTLTEPPPVAFWNRARFQNERFCVSRETRMIRNCN